MRVVSETGGVRQTEEGLLSSCPPTAEIRLCQLMEHRQRRSKVSLSQEGTLPAGLSLMSLVCAALGWVGWGFYILLFFLFVWYICFYWFKWILLYCILYCMWCMWICKTPWVAKLAETDIRLECLPNAAPPPSVASNTSTSVSSACLRPVEPDYRPCPAVANTRKSSQETLVIMNTLGAYLSWMVCPTRKGRWCLKNGERALSLPEIP